MKKNRWTQLALATASNVSTRTIRRWLEGNVSEIIENRINNVLGMITVGIDESESIQLLIYENLKELDKLVPNFKDQAFISSEIRGQELKNTIQNFKNGHLSVLIELLRIDLIEFGGSKILPRTIDILKNDFDSVEKINSLKRFFLSLLLLTVNTRGIPDIDSNNIIDIKLINNAFLITLIINSKQILVDENIFKLNQYGEVVYDHHYNFLIKTFNGKEIVESCIDILKKINIKEGLIKNGIEEKEIKFYADVINARILQRNRRTDHIFLVTNKNLYAEGGEFINANQLKKLMDSMK